MEATPDGIRSRFEGGKAPPEPQILRHGAGRGRPQPERQDDRRRERRRGGGRARLHSVDKQMRTNVPHIFAIGDIVGQPMLAHKAVHEGHVAAETARGQEQRLRRAVRSRRSPTPIPEVAWAGLTEEQCQGARASSTARPCFPGRLAAARIANGRDEGFTKLLFDETDAPRARRRHRRHPCRAT